MSKRTFTDSPAIRQRVPLLIGLVGPSGGGKTYSALRLATGIQKVTGGKIFYIDSEAKRALHYADQFDFQHVPFDAPFGSLDYLAAIEHCQRQGAKVIVVDSLSHEHEGPGGLLEFFEAELDRLSRGGDYKKRDRMKFLAWQKPKQNRRKLINAVLQMDVNVICCFRAKEKIKIKKGEDPKPLGWMPIAGEEFIYEMTVNMLLPPAANGVPEWHPDESGERMMIKLPIQFRELFKDRKPLSEATGEALARWAEGSPAGETSEQPAPLNRHGNPSPVLRYKDTIEKVERVRCELVREKVIGPDVSKFLQWCKTAPQFDNKAGVGDTYEESKIEAVEEMHVVLVGMLERHGAQKRKNEEANGVPPQTVDDLLAGSEHDGMLSKIAEAVEKTGLGFTRLRDFLRELDAKIVTDLSTTDRVALLSQINAWADSRNSEPVAAEGDGMPF